MYCYTDRQTKRSVPVEVRPPVVRRVDFPEVDVQRRPRSAGYGADAVLHLRRADDDVARRELDVHRAAAAERLLREPTPLEVAAEQHDAKQQGLAIMVVPADAVAALI